jgi:hypothetical protein
MPTNVATFTPVKLEPYMNPAEARTIAMEFSASQTLARGTVIAQITSSGKAKAYTDANTDGSGVAIGFLVYDIVVDASGNIVYGPSGATADLTRGFEKTAPVYWKGTFLESDLTGLDAAAVTDLKGREIGVGVYKAVTIG